MSHKIIRTPKTFPLNTITRSDSVTYNNIFIDFLNDLETNADRKFIQQHRDIITPETFEGKTQWAPYLSPVKNQGECGGCYAFAAVSALADRYNLLSQGALHLDLSATKIIACDLLGAEIYVYGAKEDNDKTFEKAQNEFGCYGNTLLEAWRFLHSIGTNTVECIPEQPSRQVCTDLIGRYYDTCYDGSPAVFYRVEHVYVVAGIERDGGSESSIRRNIYFHGPVSTAMDIYEAFYTFDPTKEIYSSQQGRKIGGHAIVIDGWGTENGVPFWWVRNSWGKEWGIDGYFKLIRGSNCCSCEENVMVGAPALELLGQLDESEYAVDLLNIPSENNIRRVRTSTFTMYGGIDPRTAISNRHRSYAQFSNYPEFRMSLKTNPNAFIAGTLGAPSTGARPTAVSWLLYIVLPIGVALVVFFLIIKCTRR